MSQEKLHKRQPSIDLTPSIKQTSFDNVSNNNKIQIVSRDSPFEYLFPFPLEEELESRTPSPVCSKADSEESDKGDIVQEVQLFPHPLSQSLPIPSKKGLYDMEGELEGEDNKTPQDFFTQRLSNSQGIRIGTPPGSKSYNTIGI